MTNAPQKSEKTPTESTESRLLVRYGFELARELKIDKVLVLAGLLVDRRVVENHREEEKLIWVTSGQKPESHPDFEFYVEVPGYDSDRLSQVTMGLIMAVLHREIDVNESVVCLTGVAGSKRLDNLLIANPKRDFPWFSKHAIDETPDFVSLREFVRLLEIALRFAAEGREGKPIGSIFVLGQLGEMEPHLRPLILNPLKGHVRKSRSIHDPDLLETLRELAALDGAFVVDPKGIVERAGVYIDAPLTKKVQVQKGLGARHLAAAALTAKTNGVAIVISESSGKVTVFCRGQEVLALDASR